MKNGIIKVDSTAPNIIFFAWELQLREHVSDKRIEDQVQERDPAGDDEAVDDEPSERSALPDSDVVRKLQLSRE